MELLYLLALQSISGIGPVNAKKLLQLNGNAQALFDKKSKVFDDLKGSKRFFSIDFQDPLILKKAAAEI